MPSTKAFPGWMPQGILIEHPEAFREDWEEEQEEQSQAARNDALLGYVFCLEALFGRPDKKSKARKIRLRTASVAGNTDGKVETLIEEAQRVRNALVHGEAPTSSVDMLLLRKICQRALAVVLSLVPQHKAEDLKVLLRDLPHSEFSQKEVERARERLCGA